MEILFFDEIQRSYGKEITPPLVKWYLGDP